MHLMCLCSSLNSGTLRSTQFGLVRQRDTSFSRSAVFGASSVNETTIKSLAHTRRAESCRSAREGRTYLVVALICAE